MNNDFILQLNGKKICFAMLLGLSVKELNLLWKNGFSSKNILRCLSMMLVHVGVAFAATRKSIVDKVLETSVVCERYVRVFLSKMSYERVMDFGLFDTVVNYLTHTQHKFKKGRYLINTRRCVDPFEAIYDVIQTIEKQGLYVEKVKYVDDNPSQFWLLLDDVQHTGFADVLKKLNQSKFKAVLVSLLLSLKFSAILNLFSEKFNFSENVKLGLAICENAIASGKLFTDLGDIINLFTTEILPALITGDLHKISENSYTTKIDMIHRAIAISLRADYDQMDEFTKDWSGTTETGEFHRVALFHNCLIEIQKFVMDKSNSHMLNDVSKLTSTLQCEILKWNTVLKTLGKRFIPYSIGLWGDAGVGKTSLFNRFHYVIAPTLKIKLHEGTDGSLYVYKAVNISSTSQFMDNVNSSTETITFDDMGIERKEFIPKQNSALSVFMQVQGSNLYLIPRSDLANKIGQFFMNKLTFISSNRQDYGAGDVISDIDAFRRRVMVDMHVIFNDQFNKTMNNRTIVANYLQFRDMTRRDITYTFTNDDEMDVKLRELDDDLIRHAEAYMEWREEASKATDMCLCPICKKIAQSCVCHTNILDTTVRCRTCQAILVEHGTCSCSDMSTTTIIDASGLWLVDNPDIVYSNQEVINQVITEEVIMAAFLMAVEFVFTFNKIDFKLLYACVINMFIRELIEVQICGKRINYMRLVYMGFLCIPYLFYVNVILHLLYNYALFNFPIARYCTNHLNLFCDFVSMRLMYNFTPQWVVDFDRTLAENWVARGAVSVNNNRALVLKTALAALFCFAVKKYVIDDDYENTNLGEPATEEEVEANNTIDAMVKGSPEERQDGLAMNHAWKQPNLIIDKKVSSSIPGACKSTVLSIWITTIRDRQPVRIDCQGGWSNGRVLTVVHVLKDLGNEVLFNFKFPNSTDVYTYSFNVNSPVNIRHGDICSFPWSPKNARQSIKVITDYVLQPRDEVMIGNYQFCKTCFLESSRCVCTSKVTHNPVVLFQRTAIENDVPVMLYAVSVKTEKGFSGTPVYIIKRDGVDVERRLIGLLTARMKDKSYGLIHPIPGEVYEETNTDFKEHTAGLTYLTYMMSAQDVRDKFYKFYGVPISDNLAPRSTLRHLQQEDNQIINNLGEFVGSILKAPPATETKFYKTEFYEKAQEYGAEKYTIPNLKTCVENGTYRNPILACVRQMNSIGDIRDEAPFWSAAHTLYQYLRKQVDLSTWTPYTVSEAILGDEFTTSLNRKASKGYPYNGNKDEWICGDFEQAYFKLPFTKILQDTIHDLDKGIPPLNISVASLKDEIISKAKNDAGKIRVFFAGNFSYLVLCRMYLGKFLNIFTKNRIKLFPKIGLNALGRELHEMVEYMFQHIYGNLSDLLTKKCFLDGDFSAYDKLLLVLKYAIHVVWWLACITPYFVKFRQQLLRLRLILISMMEYVVIIGEDIFIMRERIPSGLWGTAIINCFCECILEILQFFFLLHLHHSVGTPRRLDFVAHYKDDFFESVSLSNFGDDNLKCVKEVYLKIYTHENIMAFAAWIRIPITPARKIETRVEPKSILDCLFLKRVFVWNDHLNRLMGRLEMDSIGKMLAFSDTQQITLWRSAVLMTAERELAVYGPDILLRFQQRFELVITPCNNILDIIDGGDSMLVNLIQELETIDDEIEHTALISYDDKIATKHWVIAGVLLGVVLYIFPYEINNYIIHYNELPVHLQQFITNVWLNPFQPFSVFARLASIWMWIAREITSFGKLLPTVWILADTPTNRMNLYLTQMFIISISPIYEELIKHIHPFCGYVLILVESYQKIPNSINTKWDILQVILCTGMHLITTHLPLFPAMLIHSFWNAFQSHSMIVKNP